MRIQTRARAHVSLPPRSLRKWRACRRRFVRCLLSRRQSLRLPRFASGPRKKKKVSQKYKARNTFLSLTVQPYAIEPFCKRCCHRLRECGGAPIRGCLLVSLRCPSLCQQQRRRQPSGWLVRSRREQRSRRSRQLHSRSRRWSKWRRGSRKGCAVCATVARPPMKPAVLRWKHLVWHTVLFTDFLTEYETKKNKHIQHVEGNQKWKK